MMGGSGSTFLIIAKCQAQERNPNHNHFIDCQVDPMFWNFMGGN
jgi:hypothetical protein